MDESADQIKRRLTKKKKYLTKLQEKYNGKRNPDGTNIGVDISEGMLKRAKERLGKLPGVNYELKIGNAFRLEEEEEEDEHFDVLI